MPSAQVAGEVLLDGPDIDAPERKLTEARRAARGRTSPSSTCGSPACGPRSTTGSTIVIVSHDMQQAARISQKCAFFLASHGTPGVIVAHGHTRAMVDHPRDQRTLDCVNGRFE